MRYVALETPGWVLAAAVAWWLAAKAGVAPWLAALGWAAFVFKDFVLYPWLRRRGWDPTWRNGPGAACIACR